MGTCRSRASTLIVRPSRYANSSLFKALDANRSNIPLPKGPIPTNMKGTRQNMRGR